MVPEEMMEMRSLVENVWVAPVRALRDAMEDEVAAQTGRPLEMVRTWPAVPAELPLS